MTADEKFVKVVIDLYDDTFGVSGEGLWTVPLGEDLYEIRNVPFHTCAIGWGDVVRAVAEDEEHWPKLVNVVARSGHRTLHIFFSKLISDEEKKSVLDRLHEWKAYHENGDGRLYAVDVEPEGNWGAVVDYLDELSKSEKLDYRTIVEGDQELAAGSPRPPRKPPRPLR